MGAARIELAFRIDERDDAMGLRQVRDLVGAVPFRRVLQYGTGAGKIDVVYFVRGSAPAVLTSTIDVRGSLTNLAGDALNPTEAVAIAVLNYSVRSDGDKTASVLEWGPASSNGCLAFHADASDRSAVLSARTPDDPGIDIRYSGWGATVGIGADSFAITNTNGFGGESIEYGFLFLGRTF